MVNVTPAGITPGAASDSSVVHASDGALGNLSRSHNERDISRLQAAILSFSASKTYNVGDIVTNASLNWVCDVAVAVPGPFSIGNFRLITDAFAVLLQSYNTTAAGNNQFFSIIGSDNGNATEVNRQAPIPFGPIIFLRFTLTVSINNLVNPAVWFFRKNSADGNSNITIPAGITGTFQDLTNQDTMAVADLVSYQYRETGGAGAATIVGASFVTLRGES